MISSLIFMRKHSNLEVRLSYLSNEKITEVGVNNGVSELLPLQNKQQQKCVCMWGGGGVHKVLPFGVVSTREPC